MEHHDCRPPEGRQSIEFNEWTCPECGDVWTARLLGSIDPAQGYDFGIGEHFTPAEWVRLGPGEATPRTIVTTFSKGDESVLRCSFCLKPRSSVKNLIAGPGLGPYRVHICDECVDLCVEIIAEEAAEIEAEMEQQEVRGSPPTESNDSSE